MQKWLNMHNNSPGRAQGTWCGFGPTPSTDFLEEERESITQVFYDTRQMKVAMYNLNKFSLA